MANKILFCATVDYHFKAFHLPYMKWFKEQGWEVHVAASGNINLPYTDRKYTIPIKRSPFRMSNINAYKQIRKIMDQNYYSIIHCHTPLGGLLTRIAAREERKKGTKVIYTAHGFHFCKGVSIFNWLTYYPIERYLARYTDSLITINQEDYNLATTHRFLAKEIKYIAGVGVDTDQFRPPDQQQKAQIKVSLGYEADDVLLFNAGEFNKNKNQTFLLRSMVHILKDVPNVRLVLAGEGLLLEKCKRLAYRLGVDDRVSFLGFRSDIADILPICDISVAASFREGLPVNVMESMACGLPVVAVDNRGHRELVHNDRNGWIISDWDEAKFANKVTSLIKEKRSEEFGQNGRDMIITKYSTKQILKEKTKVYSSHMDGRESEAWIAP